MCFKFKYALHAVAWFVSTILLVVVVGVDPRAACLTALSRLRFFTWLVLVVAFAFRIILLNPRQSMLHHVDAFCVVHLHI